MTPRPTDLKARDRAIVERALPAHMLFLMMEECQKIGYGLRADVMRHLNMAAAAPLASCDQLSVARLARRIDDAATTLLHDLSPDDPRHGLYCCATFTLLLVDEGRIEDKGNQAVLAALLLLDDVKDDRPDEEGQGAGWRLQEGRWRNEAKKLLSRAVLMGVYAKATVRLIA
jgi:hypothetical protein